MIVWWSTPPSTVTALSVILASMTKVFVSLCQVLTRCTLRDACSLYHVRGRSCGEEALPKAGYWQSQTPSIREFTCAGDCGNMWKGIMAREQSPFIEWVTASPWDVLDAQLSFSLTAPLTVYCVFSLVKGQLLHLLESQSQLRDQSQGGKGWGLVQL